MDRKRQSSSTLCWVLAITLGLCVSALVDNKSQTNPEAEQHFQKANELQIRADYDAAIAEYQAVISLSPNTEIAQNAQYWIGQLYFESKRFDAALSAFQKLIDEYPESKTIPTTNLMIERVQQAKKNRALFEAVKEPDVEKVKLLIAAGADVNAKDAHGETPALLAAMSPAMSARRDTVRLLLSKGADISSIQLAAYLGELARVKGFLEHGVGVNPQDANAPTPLHAAAMGGQKEVAELLRQHGANE